MEALFPNTATKAVPRDEEWIKRHNEFVDEARKGRVEVLFLGDSITDGWRNDPPHGGKALWDKYFAPQKAANFGISADRTQHLLWRMKNGELDGVQPKCVVLLIGTNNTGFESDNITPRNTAVETIQGVTAVVGELRAKLPESKVLLLAIFPRGESLAHLQRLQIEEINKSLAQLSDGKRIYFLDIGALLVASDGSISTKIMPDYLHPNENGYRIMAAAIVASLQKGSKEWKW